MILGLFFAGLEGLAGCLGSTFGSSGTMTSRMRISPAVVFSVTSLLLVCALPPSAAIRQRNNIMLFCRLTLDEVKYGRRALHTEETTHQSA